MSRPVETVLSRLGSTRRSSRGWVAKCPAHEDRVASLSVSEGRDGRALIKCHAGCTTQTIVAALGLTLADLFERDDFSPRPVAARRNGRNAANGTLAGATAGAQNGSERLNTSPGEAGSEVRPLFRVSEQDIERYRRDLISNEQALQRLAALRGWTREAIERLGIGFDGRRVTFAYRDADGALVGVGRYHPNRETRGDEPKLRADAGSRRELFPAPESVESGDGWLWLVEGEPDAIRAHSLGLTAVAVPGVEGWRPEYAQRFAGRRVVVCFDCDQPGRSAAKRTVAELATVADDVRLVDLDPSRADGYDLTDYLKETEAHGTVAA